MSAQSFNPDTVQIINNYLNHYLQKTLGVSQILNQLSDPQLTAKSEVDLGFFIENYASYTSYESELFLKIIQAMKLNPNQYQIYDLTEKNKITNRIQVFFIDHPVNINETYSARILLKNPDLKKVTWAFLQTQMSQF